MQFSSHMCADAAAHNPSLNWDVYEQVTKDGTNDVCDSTSAGSSDSESGDHDSASDETHTDVETIPFYGDTTFPKPRKHKAWGRNACVATLPPPMPPMLVSGLVPPPGLPPPSAPPGLDFPPGLGLVQSKRFVSTEPPPPPIKEREGPFNLKNFRKELVATLKELSVLRNVSRAVRRVRAQNVPEEYQAVEFADLLTRAAEEPRGGTRRLWWAFAAGLRAGVDAPDGCAFSIVECQAGLKIFFQDTFPALCEEIHRLPDAAKAELVPTLLYVFPKEVMEAVLPAELR